MKRGDLWDICKDWFCFVLQRLVPDDGKGKVKKDIQIDASLRDQRGDNDPDYWRHTDATTQFQQVCSFASQVFTLCAKRPCWDQHVHTCPPAFSRLMQGLSPAPP